MSIAFKPDVSTLQIVEVDVCTSQKMGKPTCMNEWGPIGKTEICNQLHKWVVAKIESYATIRQSQ